jgi:hypothetical protein
MRSSERSWWRGKRAVCAAAVLTLSLVHGGAAVYAEAGDDGADPFSVEVHGFGGQGFILTTGNDYLVADSKRGSFQMSEVGINFSKFLTDKLRFGVQFVAQNFAAAGSYTPQVDWFILDYHWSDWLGLRAGRLKIPYGLYNEVNDIDSARVPVLLPQSVYPLQARSFLFAQTGAEIYGYLRGNGAGGLDYRVFGGTVYIDPKLVVPVGTPVELTFNVPYAFGGRLIWETPLRGLRLGASYLKLRLDSTAFLPMGVSAGIENHSSTWVAFADYNFRMLTLTAEYGRGYTKQEASIPGSNIDVTTEAGYVMATVTATSWLQTALYYALKYPDIEKRQGLSNKQHDVSLTVRFDLNSHWLFKLEGHYMAGITGLLNPLRVGPPPANPDKRWAVFLAKTTVYF